MQASPYVEFQLKMQPSETGKSTLSILQENIYKIFSV